MHENSTYDKFFRPEDDFISILASQRGEAMLDEEIMKIREQIGEEQFTSFSKMFFKDKDFDYDTVLGANNLCPCTQIPNELLNEETQCLPSSTEPKAMQVKKLKKQLEETKKTNVECANKMLMESKMRVVVKERQEEEIEEEDGQTEYTSEEERHEQVRREELERGKWRVYYKNGDVYEGEMEGGVKSGWGEYKYANGERYSGCFVEDEIHGYGQYYFLSGAEYEGDWSSGMKHGIGVLTFANKDVYQGSFAFDDLHGQGTYTHNNHDVFHGTFVKGLRHGHGILHTADGLIRKGNWTQGTFQV